MKIIDELEEELKQHSRNLPAEEFILRGVWKFDMAFKPAAYDSVYRDTGILAQTTGTGFCTCSNDEPPIDPNWLGQDIRELAIQNRSARIAILDAGFSSLQYTPAYSTHLRGSIQEKTTSRAHLITGEMLRLCDTTNVSHLSFLVVGAVGNIIRELASTGAQIHATDLDESLVNNKLGGVQIEDGRERTIPLLHEADVALVTGMTLSTDTLDNIIAAAQGARVKIVIFAQTGANMAPHYLDYGIKTVLAESFPSCIFPGDTLVRIYRSN